MNENTMFCYQCEQTARGTGCVLAGICGKGPALSSLQDLLVYQLEGLGFWAERLQAQKLTISPATYRLVLDALFATLTNVNFDPQRFITWLRQVDVAKTELRMRAGEPALHLPQAAAYSLPESEEAILADAERITIRPYARLDADQQSLRDTLLFGLKGIAAYGHHAWVLGRQDNRVNQFVVRALSAILDESLTPAQLLDLLMELGQANLIVMELLDAANTGAFGNPTPTPVRASLKKGPFIIISGHDLEDLRQLLEQTEGKGINIYTHGEMLPGHGYPELKKYPHLAGNYGGAWQNQQREFDDLPGCVLMTTNCLMPPRPSYKDRLFTTGVVGWSDVPHIEANQDGKKDFSAVIHRALELGGYAEDESEKTLTTGFGHAATLGAAGAIIDAVKSGQIRHFFLVGGCDGVHPGRSYFTEFVQQTPPDTVILTLACGKFRFNHLDLGTVAELPRLLDIGQCNDAYSAIKIASALADAFNCTVNDLPLTLVLSWYEQKAVSILLTLLSLGIRNIYLGPTLPAFISSNVLNILVEKFGLRPISTPEADLEAILGGVKA